MAMTELTLIFVGLLATLATLGLFADFQDLWTQTVVQFAAALLWALFGLSSWDVIIPSGSGQGTTSASIMPFVLLGLGLAFAVAIFAFYSFIAAIGQSANVADTDALQP